MVGEFGELPSQVALFPLPDGVLFPRQVLPLHVFEPRYRAMLADALQQDRYLAIALLRRGYEPDYFTLRAAIHPIVGVGRIVCASRLADGRYNVLLRGEARAEVLSETTDKGYRVARVRPLATTHNATQHECCQLRELLRTATTVGACTSLSELFESDLTLGAVADLLASGLRVAGEVRQGLLAEPDDFLRAQSVLDALRTLRAIDLVQASAARTQGPILN